MAQKKGDLRKFKSNRFYIFFDVSRGLKRKNDACQNAEKNNEILQTDYTAGKYMEFTKVL